MAASAASSPGNAQSGHAKLGLKSLITVVSTIVLVATEFIALGVAGGWAIAGILELGDLFEYIFMAAFGLLGVWGAVRFARGAWKREAEHQHT